MKKSIKFKLFGLLALFVFSTLIFTGCAEEKIVTVEKHIVPAEVVFKNKEIDNVNIFYREAGNPENPALLLLHGFPASSHQYRKVLSALGDQYYLIAPDYPAFGESDFPNPKEFEYTFDNLGNIMDKFVQSFGLDSYTLMIHDYGGPIGFRIAMKHPEKVNGFIVKNANIYEEGLGDAWAGVRELWKANSSKNREALKVVFKKESLKWQYTHGVKEPNNINPDNWILDAYRMSSPEMVEAQLDLFYDYRKNVEAYPKWQEYLRKNQPPMLIVWGKNDAFFPESGAEAYKKDVNKIDYNIYDTGHFALEEKADDIIPKMRSFLDGLNKK